MKFFNTITDKVLNDVKNEPVLKDCVDKLYVVKNLDGDDNLILVLNFSKKLRVDEKHKIEDYISNKYNIEVNNYNYAYNYMFKDLVRCNIIKLPDASVDTFLKNFVVREEILWI